MRRSSDETRQLVRRFADTARDIEAWVERGGSRWWLRGWLADVRYLLSRIEDQDEMDRLEDK
jgi:hypothetical protein